LRDDGGNLEFCIARQRLETGAGQFRGAQEDDSQCRHADSQREIALRRKEKVTSLGTIVRKVPPVWTRIGARKQRERGTPDSSGSAWREQVLADKSGVPTWPVLGPRQFHASLGLS
jgi:hypothetical protein